MDQQRNMAVTVIGGYLGAGKTTLVNHILRTADQRVAVLVNDFGDVNIDAELIERQDGDTISLANGCICCSLVDGLAAALTTLRELEPQPERLVIEASGVADPASIAAYGHGPGMTLDAVIVVADAETVRKRAGDKYVGDTVLSQIRAADILLLNKTDLLNGDQVDAVNRWIKGVAPTAVIIETEHSRIGPELLFGQAPNVAERAAVAEGHVWHDPDHGGQHEHGAVFESWTWRSDQPVPRIGIEEVMAQLPEEIFRAKGLVTIQERPDKIMILQRVGGRWSLRPGDGPPGDVGSRIVFIGLAGAIDDRWLADRLPG